MIEPCAPLSDAEHELLAHIGERSPCTRRWLEHFVPQHRYYAAYGLLDPGRPRSPHEPAETRGLAVPAIIIRLKDAEGLREWRARRWHAFTSPPRIIEATLVTLRGVEQLVTHLPAGRDRLVWRGQVTGENVTVRVHLSGDAPFEDTGDSLAFWECLDLPPSLRAARPGDPEPQCPNQQGDPFLSYVPPGCALEVWDEPMTRLSE